jgi:hypothetical protein
MCSLSSFRFCSKYWFCFCSSCISPCLSLCIFSDICHFCSHCLYSIMQVQYVVLLLFGGFRQWPMKKNIMSIKLGVIIDPDFLCFVKKPPTNGHQWPPMAANCRQWLPMGPRGPLTVGAWRGEREKGGGGEVMILKDSVFLFPSFKKHLQESSPTLCGLLAASRPHPTG